MITITTEIVCKYLKVKFPNISDLIRNGNINKSAEKSIGVFLGPDTRSNGVLAIGGVDCTVVRQLPTTIQIRWTENQVEHDNMAVEIYDAFLTESDNFMVDNVKIACIELLDP